MGAMRTRPRLTTIATALVMLVTGAGLPPTMSAQSPAASAGPVVVPDLALPDDASLAADAGLAVADSPVAASGPIDADAVIDDALATADALSDADWEVGALATTLGDDPAAAFRLLRDRIGFEPYAGAMRGADGTLAARAGNAYDRALLLRALLDAMGSTSRFAFGELDDETARALLAHALDAPADPLPDAGGLAGATFDLDALALRARRDHALLRMTLDDAGLTLGATPAADLVADVRAHAWVQVERDGAWVDLDPSLPASEPGQRLVEPSGTSDALPDDAWQTVTFRVVASHVADVGLTADTVLERRLTAAEAARADVFLYFLPEGGGGGLLGGPSTGGLVPQLLVDREVQAGTPFSADAGGEGDFFGLGGGGGPALAGVQVEVMREGPGLDALSTVVPIVDRVPDGLDPASVTVDGLLPMAANDDGPVALGAVRHLIVSTGGLSPRETAIARAGAMSFVGSGMLEDGALADYAPGDVLWPIAVADRQAVLASERLLVPAVEAPGSVAAVVDRPRVWVSSFGADPADQSRLTTSIDLAADAIRLVARPDTDPADLARRQLWYGVLESALETEALLQSAAFAEPEGLALEGASLSMMRPLVAVVDRAGLPDEADPALAAAVAAGDVAVVPGDPATATTWWTVALGDGSTRAIVTPGLGGAVARRTEPADRHQVQGGWTPGGGSYVNSAQNGVRWVINESTLETEGYIRDGRFYRYARNAPQARTCAGGTEYSEILGCVSVPTAIVLGTVTSVIVIWAVARCVRALR